MRRIIVAGAVARRVAELAREISAHYGGERILCVGVLKGACLFLADLARRIAPEPEIDFVKLSSYGSGTRHGESLRFELDV